MAKVTGKAYISLDGTKLHSKADKVKAQEGI